MEKISSLQKRITNEKLTKVSELRQDEVNVITSVSSIALMEHFIAGEKVCFSNCLWLCAFALLFVQTLSNIILSYIKEKICVSYQTFVKGICMRIPQLNTVVSIARRQEKTRRHGKN